MRNYQSYLELPYNPLLRDRARELRKTGNLSEVLLWKKLSKKQFRGYDFDRQKIIGDFIVDFFCLDCGVVIEVDGDSHMDKHEYDTEREAFLAGFGLVVVRIPADDVLQRLDRVMDRLYHHPALTKPPNAPHNHPGPSGHPSTEGNDL